MADTNPLSSDLDDAAYQRALAILLDVGTSIAQELKAASPDLSVADRAKAFEGVALAVRRTIILSRHVAEAPATARVEPPNADTRRAMQRKQVIRTVEETIDRKADPADAGALRRELLERVDTLDFDTDLAHRSPADLIKNLCRDLGAADIPGLYTFPRRTPDDVALLNAQAAALPGTGIHLWSTQEDPGTNQNPLLEPSPARGRGQGEGGATSRSPPLG